jgi:AAA15 family ATPase/GTPase
MEKFLLGFVPLNINGAEQLFIKYKNLIIQALTICDSDISNITTIREKIPAPKLPDGLQIPDFPQKSIDLLRFETYHARNPNIPFDLNSEESIGTVKFFNMLLLLLNVIQENKTLMLDEFDQSLHSKLTDFVIDLFQASNSAQFLFSTHNTNLINIKKLRRDQILFVNKKNDGSTEVYSLYDYKDFRENMDAAKGYLQGRFDAIPMINTSAANLKKLINNKD